MSMSGELAACECIDQSHAHGLSTWGARNTADSFLGILGRVRYVDDRVWIGRGR